MTCSLWSVAHSLMSSIERRITLSRVDLVNTCCKRRLMKAAIREVISARCVQSETSNCLWLRKSVTTHYCFWAFWNRVFCLARDRYTSLLVCFHLIVWNIFHRGFRRKKCRKLLQALVEWPDYLIFLQRAQGKNCSCTPEQLMLSMALGWHIHTS